jgi:hypothetical protein
MLLEERYSLNHEENEDKLGRLSISEVNSLNFRLNKNFNTKRFRKREFNFKHDDLNSSGPKTLKINDGITEVDREPTAAISTNNPLSPTNGDYFNTDGQVYSIKHLYNVLDKYYKICKIYGELK